jgi:hypothetical protein
MYEARQQHKRKSPTAKPARADKLEAARPLSPSAIGGQRKEPLSKARIKAIADRAEGLKD